MKPPIEDPDWTEDVRPIYKHDMREMWDSTISPHTYNSYHEDLRLYKGLVELYTPRSILDVGCAQGTLA